MAEKQVAPIVVNGWSIYLHPLLLDQLEEMYAKVEASKVSHPDDWQDRKVAKLLKATLKVIFEVIPTDPTDTGFRQGNTLGSENRQWFRAKFVQQYRLFFRFDASAKVVVCAWVNDENTLRAYGDKDDAYATFKRMLAKGNPPGDFNTLIAESIAALPRCRELKLR